MSRTRSKVMKIANSLVKHGMSRRTVMLKAWIIVKASALRTKIKGTSRRQSELENLAGVNSADIKVMLKREPRNRHDSNAIAVYAVLSNHRVFFIGYLPRALACITAPLFDKGCEICPTSFRVTGGFNPWVNFGAALTLVI